MPYAFVAPYDKHCDICGYEAAWVAGGGVALCDCCAQDWTEWNDKHHGLEEKWGIKGAWVSEYHHFKETMLKGYRNETNR